MTEAGDGDYGRIKSTAGIATLLAEGLGDTLRVSLTEAPEKEIPVCYSILQSLGLRKTMVEYIACPSCGRTLFNLEDVLHKVRDSTSHLKGLDIAVMGCIVNGPGEMPMLTMDMLERDLALLLYTEGGKRYAKSLKKKVFKP